MNRVRIHRRKLDNIPRLRVLSIGEQVNDACGNVAHDPCPDSWKTLLFLLASRFKEVRQYCPEIPVEIDLTQVHD
jgi:hypothetical protein